jgi:hypothetical protein
MSRQEFQINRFFIGDIDIELLLVSIYANCTDKYGSFTIRFNNIFELSDASYINDDFIVQYKNTLHNLFVGKTLYYKYENPKYQDVIIISNAEDNLYEKFVEHKLCNQGSKYIYANIIN